MSGSEGLAGVTGATSFNWNAFAQQQQEQALEAGHSGATLAAAAKLYLSDSSDSSSHPSQKQKGPYAPSSDRKSTAESSDEERRKRKKRKRGKHRDDKEKCRKKKHSKHKRRKTDAEKVADIEAELAATGQLPIRRGAVKGWLGNNNPGPSVGPQLGDYYFDTKGDRDNLLYQALYRADVAAYRRLGGPSQGPRGPAGWSKPRFGQGVLTETDGHDQGQLRQAGQRYYSAPAARKERSRTLRRIKLAQDAQENSAAAILQGKGGPGALLEPQGALTAVLGLGINKDSNKAVAVTDDQQRLRLPQPDFIPLKSNPGGAQGGPPAMYVQQTASGLPMDVPVGQQQQPEEVQEGESRTDWVLRRTKELNTATRERPFDLQLWLDFAAFQEEAAAVGAQKVSERSVKEKQISILEKALAHHPGSEALLLALLKAVGTISDPIEVSQRWQRVLSRHPGSGLLWSHYLQHTRGAFATFATSALRKGYCDALAALRGEAHRRADEGAPSSEVVKVEKAWVELFLQAVQFEMAAGYTEVAMAYLQTVLEFNFFAPAQGALPPQALGRAPQGAPTASAAMLKRRAFESFWESGSPLIGDEGALGWAPGAPEGPPAPPLPPESDAGPPQEAEGDVEGEVGGWSGWMEVIPAAVAPEEGAEGEGKSGDEQSEDVDGETDGQNDDDEVQMEPQETEEELMERLGIRLEAGLAELEAAGTETVLDDTGMASWLALECERDAEGWQPRRKCKEGTMVGGKLVDDAEGDDDAAAVVDIDDVRDVLYTVDDSTQRELLLLGCLSLLGTPLPPMWCSTNSPWWTQRAALAATLPELLQLSGLALWNLPHALTQSPLQANGANGGKIVAGGNSTEKGELNGVSGSVLGSILGSVSGSVLGVSSGVQQWFSVGAETVSGYGPMQHAAQLQQDAYGDAMHVDEPHGVAETTQQALQQLQQQAQVLWFAANPGRRQFLLRVLRALLAQLPGQLLQQEKQMAGVLLQYDVCLAWLHTEAAGPDGSQEVAREAAKKLLAVRSTDAVLWTAYAAWEYSCGNSKVVRKVIDATLQSLGGLAPYNAPSIAPSMLYATRLAQLAVELAQTALAQASEGSNAGPKMQKAASSAVQYALHVLSWLAGQAPSAQTKTGPYIPLPKSTAPAQAPPEAFIVSVRKGFQSWLSWLAYALSQNSAEQQNVQAILPHLVHCATAYELLYPSLPPSNPPSLAPSTASSTAPSSTTGGPLAAAALFQGVMRLTDGQTQSSSRHWEQLHVLYCSIMVDRLYSRNVKAAVVAALTPSRVHQALTQALLLYPRNPQLLLLLCESEVRGHSVSRLRAALHALLRSAGPKSGSLQAGPQGPLEDLSSPTAALLAARVEMLRAGGAKGVPAVFESALAHPVLRGCPLLWRQYMQYECGRRAMESSRRVYLRGINACPGSKVLWVHGLAVLLGMMSAKERNELLEVAGSKGVRLRTDVYEILLQRMEGELQA